MPITTRLTEMLGIDYPIVQAPMGWIARAPLASPVSRAGGLGIIETSSGALDEIKDEIATMRTLTDKPFGVNIAQAFVRDPGIVDFVIGEGVTFVTTSAGDPTKYCRALKEAGLTVFLVVPTLKAAPKAIEAGVDGLLVEGGGFKNPDPVMTMVLPPPVREHTHVPIIAAGGITCGRTMATAFALGADGVQLGTRMVSVAESPVHQNCKNAILAAQETDTVFLNQFSRPALPALRTEKSEALLRKLGPTYDGPPVMAEFGHAKDLYFGGGLEASLALSGQVAGRIDSVKPVKQIIDEMVAGFHETIGSLHQRFPA